MLNAIGFQKAAAHSGAVFTLSFQYENTSLFSGKTNIFLEKRDERKDAMRPRVAGDGFAASVASLTLDSLFYYREPRTAKVMNMANYADFSSSRDARNNESFDYSS